MFLETKQCHWVSSLKVIPALTKQPTCHHAIEEDGDINQYYLQAFYIYNRVLAHSLQNMYCIISTTGQTGTLISIICEFFLYYIVL